MTLALFALLVVLQLADIVTTHRVLGRGGREHNALLAWLFARCGVLPVLVLTKGIFVALAWRYLIHWPWAIAAFCAVYAGVVWRNGRELRRA